MRSDFIKSASRIFRMDAQYIVSGTTWLGFDQAVNVATSIITTIVLTNIVSKAIYGSYVYLLGICMLLLPVTLTGMSNAIIQSAARAHDGSLARGMAMRLKGGFVVSVILAGISVAFFVSGRIDAAWALGMACVIYPFAFAADDYKSYLQGRQDFKRYACINATVNAAVCAATVWAAVASGGLFAILTANLAARGAGNLLAYFRMRGLLRNRNVDEKFDGFGKRLSAVAAVNGISYSIDQVLVGSLFTMEIMASYGLASRLSEPFRFLGLAVNRLAWPKAARMQGPYVAGKFLSKLALLMAMLIIISLAVFASMPFLIRFVFPAYRDVTPLAMLMIFSAMSAVVVTYLETYFISQDNLQRFYYFASTARPAATIALMIPCMHWWGFWGAVWARLFVRLASAVVLTGRMYIEYRKSFEAV